MKYREFTEMMLRFADEVEKICEFRDVKAYEVETDSNDECYLKDEMLVLTELFCLDSFVKAVRYLNKPRVEQGYISLENDKPVFISDDIQIQLKDSDFLEYGIQESDGEASYNPDDIYFYQLEELKELYKLPTLEGLQAQIRLDK